MSADSDGFKTVFASGNPVFDAMVTIICNKNFKSADYEKIHDLLLKLAAKEPGGFREALSLRAQAKRGKD